MDRDSLVIAVRLLYEEAYLKYHETDQLLYLGKAAAYSRVLDLLLTSKKVKIKEECKWQTKSLE